MRYHKLDIPRQCRSCGGFCGGGYGNKFCKQESGEPGKERCSSLCHPEEPCSITKDGKCDAGLRDE